MDTAQIVLLVAAVVAGIVVLRLLIGFAIRIALVGGLIVGALWLWRPELFEGIGF